MQYSLEHYQFLIQLYTPDPINPKVLLLFLELCSKIHASAPKSYLFVVTLSFSSISIIFYLYTYSINFGFGSTYSLIIILFATFLCMVSHSTFAYVSSLLSSSTIAYEGVSMHRLSGSTHSLWIPCLFSV